VGAGIMPHPPKGGVKGQQSLWKVDAKASDARMQRRRQAIDPDLAGMDGEASLVATVRRQQGEVSSLLRRALSDLDKLQSNQLRSLQAWSSQSTQDEEARFDRVATVPARPAETPPPLVMVRGESRSFTTPAGPGQVVSAGSESSHSQEGSASSSTSQCSSSASSSSAEERKESSAPVAPLTIATEESPEAPAASPRRSSDALRAPGTPLSPGLSGQWASGGRALPWCSEQSGERPVRTSMSLQSEDRMSAIIPVPQEQPASLMQTFMRALGRMQPEQQIAFLNTSSSFTEEEELDMASLQKSRTAQIGKWKKPSWKRLRRLIVAVVHSWHFTNLCSTMILANCVYIGVQSQAKLQAARKGDDLPRNWFYAEASFCVWFSVELLFRMIAYGSRFLYGKDWRWNVFDSLLVVNCLGEMLLEGLTPNFGFLRVLRIVRMARVLRLIRVMRFFRALRLMVYSIMHSMLSLLWVFLLLALMMYVFTICFMFAVEQYLLDTVVDAHEVPREAEAIIRRQLLDLFGNVPKAMLTLFQTVSGGRDWSEVTEPLLEVSYIYVVMFIMYVFFIVFGVLNVVTGAFVDSIRLVSSRDRDAVVEEELRRQNDYIAALHLIFHEADYDGSGTLTWEEFESHLQDFRVKAYFSTLELDVSHAKALFLLLDVDETNEVEIDEFVQGCLRLKGGAKSIDVNMLLYENEKLISKLTELGDYVEDKFGQVDQALGIQCNVAEKRKKKEKEKVRKGGANDRLDQAVNMMQLVKATSGEDLRVENTTEMAPDRSQRSSSAYSNSRNVSKSSARKPSKDPKLEAPPSQRLPPASSGTNLSVPGG